MTKEEEIKSIEFRLKAIFSQDVVKAIHVIESKELFSKWKVFVCVKDRLRTKYTISRQE